MPLNANALTSLANVLDELGLEDDDGPRDARLERYIDAASATAARYCNRVFERADALVEDYQAGGGVFLHLRRTPVLAVTSVEVNGGTLDAAEYDLRNLKGTEVPGKLYRDGGWPWSAHTTRGPTFGPIPGTEEHTIQVTYNGGWVTRPQSLLAGGPFEGQAVTLPADLEDAAIMMVATRWRGRDRDRTVTQHQFENQTLHFGGLPIPAEILEVLNAYQRVPQR